MKKKESNIEEIFDSSDFFILTHLSFSNNYIFKK
jgi:hypothetical protein